MKFISVVSKVLKKDLLVPHAKHVTLPNSYVHKMISPMNRLTLKDYVIAMTTSILSFVTSLFTINTQETFLTDFIEIFKDPTLNFWKI